MKKLITVYYAVSLLLFSGCDLESTTVQIQQYGDGKTMWVSFHFNIPEEDKVAAYYYIGRIKEQMYELIVDGEIKEGMLLLRDVRYWDEVYKEYEDDEYSGDIVFRVEHIAKMIPVKGDPMTFGTNISEQVEP